MNRSSVKTGFPWVKFGEAVPIYEIVPGMNKSKTNLITILAHVLGWVVFAIGIYFYHPLFSDIDITYQAWITQTVTLVVLISAFYINVFILVPRFLLNNRLWVYFLLAIALIAAVGFINRSVEKAFDDRGPFVESRQAHSSDQVRIPPSFKPGKRSPVDRPTIIIAALVLGIGTSITAIQKWQKDKQMREALEKEKISSELSFLKAQINPHFFFNTLNNIYALTQVNGEEAGKAIYQLSRMMRYLLYETQQGHTLLSRELAFMQDYISLMQLRLTDTATVIVNTPDNLEDLPIAPMILLPFVENAFKHGLSATAKCHIHIQVSQRNSQLDVTVKNSIIHDNSVSLDTNSGIGLMNTRRRLDLLYPGKYTLDTGELAGTNEYIVHLTLDLT